MYHFYDFKNHNIATLTKKSTARATKNGHSGEGWPFWDICGILPGENRIFGHYAVYLFAHGADGGGVGRTTEHGVDQLGYGAH